MIAAPATAKAAIIIIGLLLLALIGSGAANVLLFNEWMQARDRASTAEANLSTANEGTRICNKSVTDLAEAARKRGIQAGLARAASKQKAEELEKEAQGELSTPAAVPGDDCRSAQIRVTRILGERGKP